MCPRAVLRRQNSQDRASTVPP